MSLPIKVKGLGKHLLTLAEFVRKKYWRYYVFGIARLDSVHLTRVGSEAPSDTASIVIGLARKI